jgi:hypothetical protein
MYGAWRSATASSKWNNRRHLSIYLSIERTLDGAASPFTHTPPIGRCHGLDQDSKQFLCLFCPSSFPPNSLNQVRRTRVNMAVGKIYFQAPKALFGCNGQITQGTRPPTQISLTTRDHMLGIPAEWGKTHRFHHAIWIPKEREWKGTEQKLQNEVGVLGLAGFMYILRAGFFLCR